MAVFSCLYACTVYCIVYCIVYCVCSLFLAWYGVRVIIPTPSKDHYFPQIFRETFFSDNKTLFFFFKHPNPKKKNRKPKNQKKNLPFLTFPIIIINSYSSSLPPSTPHQKTVLSPSFFSTYLSGSDFPPGFFLRPGFRIQFLSKPFFPLPLPHRLASSRLGSARLPPLRHLQ